VIEPADLDALMAHFPTRIVPTAVRRQSLERVVHDPDGNVVELRSIRYEEQP